MASRIWVAMAAAGKPRSDARTRSMSMASSGLGGLASMRTSAVPGSRRSRSEIHFASRFTWARSGPTTRTMIGNQSPRPSMVGGSEIATSVAGNAPLSAARASSLSCSIFFLRDSLGVSKARILTLLTSPLTPMIE